MTGANAVAVAALVAVTATGLPAPLQAQTATGQQQSPQTGAQTVAACSLLPKDEVKQHLPWPPVLDQMPIEEEAVGTSGSSCNYPSVFIQVLPFSPRTIELARQKGGLETVDDVGDEAYFYNNGDRYAELYVRVGKYLLTVQANANDTVDGVKPGAVSLAKALVVKLH